MPVRRFRRQWSSPVDDGRSGKRNNDARRVSEGEPDENYYDAVYQEAGITLKMTTITNIDGLNIKV